MNIFHYSLFAALIASGALLHATESAAGRYESDIRFANQECLQLISQNRGFGSSYQLRFYNACSDRVWASACIEERAGRFKLHESPSKIPAYGYWTIFTYEGAPPVSMGWLSATSRPGAIGQCALPDSKFKS